MRISTAFGGEVLSLSYCYISPILERTIFSVKVRLVVLHMYYFGVCVCLPICANFENARSFSESTFKDQRRFSIPLCVQSIRIFATLISDINVDMYFFCNLHVTLHKYSFVHPRYPSPSLFTYVLAWDLMLRKCLTKSVTMINKITEINTFKL